MIAEFQNVIINSGRIPTIKNYLQSREQDIRNQTNQLLSLLETNSTFNNNNNNFNFNNKNNNNNSNNNKIQEEENTLVILKNEIKGTLNNLLTQATNGNRTGAIHAAQSSASFGKQFTDKLILQSKLLFFYFYFFFFFYILFIFFLFIFLIFTFEILIFIDSYI